MKQHSYNSSFREKLIEHLLISELLKYSWQKGDCTLEISKPEVDRTGYDLVAECNGYIRHIQLKSTYRGANTSRQKVHIDLAHKPSGCVVWVYFDQDSLELGPYFFFGGIPGEALPDISTFKMAKHTKGNARGNKAERPNIRELKKSTCIELESVRALWHSLFGITSVRNTNRINSIG